MDINSVTFYFESLLISFAPTIQKGQSLLGCKLSRFTLPWSLEIHPKRQIPKTARD